MRNLPIALKSQGLRQASPPPPLHHSGVRQHGSDPPHPTPPEMGTCRTFALLRRMTEEASSRQCGIFGCDGENTLFPLDVCAQLQAKSVADRECL